MFVVDCSITMAWLFQDEKTPFTEKIFDRLIKEKAVVPNLWSLEVINVLLVGERRKRISVSQSAHFLNVLGQLPIEIEANPPKMQNDSVLFLARTYGLSSYDAAYLDLASRLGIPLATLDADLIKAAHSSGVLLLK